MCGGGVFILSTFLTLVSRIAMKCRGKQAQGQGHPLRLPNRCLSPCTSGGGECNMRASVGPAACAIGRQCRRVQDQARVEGAGQHPRPRSPCMAGARSDIPAPDAPWRATRRRADEVRIARNAPSPVGVRTCVRVCVRACVRARVCERARVSFMFCAHKSCLMLV